MACGIREGIAIAATEVYKFDIIVDAGEKDVVGLQVKVEHLMAMQIVQDGQQLTKEFVSVLPLSEVVGLRGKALRKWLTIDILHQDAIVAHGDVAH
jgi:hypothetical protein